MPTPLPTSVDHSAPVDVVNAQHKKNVKSLHTMNVCLGKMCAQNDLVVLTGSSNSVPPAKAKVPRLNEGTSAHQAKKIQAYMYN